MVQRPRAHGRIERAFGERQSLDLGPGEVNVRDVVPLDVADATDPAVELPLRLGPASCLKDLPSGKFRKAVGMSATQTAVPYEIRDEMILEELRNGTPWDTIAEKYQVSTRTISEILSHRHCIVCATPIFMGEGFCGSECEEKFKRGEARRRKYMTLMSLLLFLPFFLLILLLGYHH